MHPLGKTIVWSADIKASVKADSENEGYFRATVSVRSYLGNLHEANGTARDVDRALCFAMEAITRDMINATRSKEMR